MKDIKDPLDKALRAKLRDAESTDTPSWEAFEKYRAQRLESAAKPVEARASLRLAVFRRVASVAAVVFVMLGSGYLLFFGQNDLRSPEAVLDQYTAISEDIPSGVTTLVNSEVASPDVVVREPKAPRVNTIDKRIVKSASIKSVEITENVASNVDQKIATVVGNSGADIVSNETVTPKPKTAVSRNVDPRSYAIVDEPRRMSRPISMGASASVGYSSPAIAPSRIAALSAVPMSYSVGKYVADVDVDNVDFQHKFPVTVGLSVRMPIGERLSLESGLTYSYLESTAAAASNFNYRYTQRSHYLGVPLALNFSIVASKRWELYCSAGAMVEWALSSINTAQVYDNSMHVSTTDRRRDVKSALWSFNAALGVNFNITPSFALYAEPGVSAYTENASHPITYRTQSPVSFNLRAGFRLVL